MVPRCPYQLPQVMGWKVASGIRHRPCPRVDLDTSALSQVPSPALAIPSSRSSSRKAKAGQREQELQLPGASPEPPDSPTGSCQQRREQGQDPEPSASLEAPRAMGSVQRAALRRDQEPGQAEQWGEQAASSRGMGATGPGSWDLAISLRESSSRTGEVWFGGTSSQRCPGQALPIEGETQPLTWPGAEAEGWQQGQSVGHTWGQAGTGRSAESGDENCHREHGWLQPVQPGALGALLLHVALQEEDDGGVALCCLLELLQGDLVILVLVHLSEDLVNALLGRQPILVHPHHDHSPHHLVNGLQRGEEQSTRGGTLGGQKVPGQGRDRTAATLCPAQLHPWAFQTRLWTGKPILWWAQYQ